VAAAIVLAADAEVGEILAYCDERLARFKTPKQLFIVDAIPRTATGKLQRSRLPVALGIAAPPSSR
jgi:fatty-acyl-CoA synthase